MSDLVAVGTKVRNIFPGFADHIPLGMLGTVSCNDGPAWLYEVDFDDENEDLRGIPMDREEFEVVED